MVQLTFFGAEETPAAAKASTTFSDNMRLPVHRWYRYSAGFSAQWVESLVGQFALSKRVRLLDPFAGSGTTLLCAERTAIESVGVESHPFVARIARAKLHHRSCPKLYRAFARDVLHTAHSESAAIESYATLIRKCFHDSSLRDLDRLRRSFERHADGSPASELTWLTLVSILRGVSHVGTAQWQYVLPRKSKSRVSAPFPAFEEATNAVYRDMLLSQQLRGPAASLVEGDARDCDGVPDGFATLVVTSPPYPNNYDYADATRLEMTFLGEITGWGDLQSKVRTHLVRSCSQHVPEKAVNLKQVLEQPELSEIGSELSGVCAELAAIRQLKGGKKTYHLMVACYFHDMARTWLALRRVCDSPSQVCFVIGDSAPYGVYVPVMVWMQQLALAAGFRNSSFEKTRDRNVKWKNRKHRVPLCEGRLWVEG